MEKIPTYHQIRALLKFAQSTGTKTSIRNLGSNKSVGVKYKKAHAPNCVLSSG